MAETVTWRVNGLNLAPPRYVVLAADEEDAIPAPRGENLVVPLRDGQWFVPKRVDARTVTLGVAVRGSTPAELLANMDLLRQNLIPGRLVVLERVLPDGTVRQAEAEVADAVSITDRGPIGAKVAITFRLPGAWWYATADSVHQEVSINNLPRVFTVHHPGTAPQRSRLTISLWTDAGCTVTAPKLVHLDTGLWVAFGGVVGGGQTLVLDVENFTATLAGNDVSDQVTHDGDPLWFVLEPGDNALRLEGGLSGEFAHLELRWRAAYA